MYYKKEIDYRTQAHTLTWISLPSFIPTTQILSLPHSFIPATQILSLSLSVNNSIQVRNSNPDNV